jgi:hypothetical protein
VGILRGLLKTLLTQIVELAIEKRVGFWNFKFIKMKKILLEKFAQNLVGRHKSSLIMGGYDGGDSAYCDYTDCSNSTVGCSKCIVKDKKECCSSDGASCC